MAKLVSGVDEKFAGVASSHPEFAGKKAILLRGTLERDSAHATPPGWRTEFLTGMGLDVPDVPEIVPRDQMAAVLRAADVLIWLTESDADQAALLADPVIGALPATRHVFTGKDLAGAIAFASPLSYPVVADQLPALLARAL
jgi:iron complex transport system substrate-binding protein